MTVNMLFLTWRAISPSLLSHHSVNKISNNNKLLIQIQIIFQKKKKKKKVLKQILCLMKVTPANFIQNISSYFAFQITNMLMFVVLGFCYSTIQLECNYFSVNWINCRNFFCWFVIFESQLFFLFLKYF